jgi:hypothetical protein
VSVGGRGRTMRAVLIGRRSSRSSSSPETGSLPFSSTYFSINRFSKTAPTYGGQKTVISLLKACCKPWRLTNLTSSKRLAPQELRRRLKNGQPDSVHKVQSCMPYSRPQSILYWYVLCNVFNASSKDCCRALSLGDFFS